MPQTVDPAARTPPPSPPPPPPPPAPATPPSRYGRRAPWWPLLILLPVATVLYALSFRTFPIIDRQHSVLADADAANFKLLLEEFDLSRRFGDPYNAVTRSVEDNAQKHKIHHVLYPMLAHPLYLGLRALERVAGLSGERAAYSVNAVVTAVNLILLYLLLQRLGRPRQPAWPFVLLYAGSLSTWIYAGVPESWPLSATLVLAFFLLLETSRTGPGALAALVGVFMLNNMTLIGLLAPLWLRHLPRGGGVIAFVRLVIGTGLAAVAVWLGALGVLSVFDPTLRPDRLLHYTFWFKQFVVAELPPWSPYVWKSVLTNLFVNSFASNQANPALPQEALLYTFQQSVLGAVTVAAVLGLMALTAIRGVSETAREARPQGWLRTLQTNPSGRLVLYCLVQVAVTIVMYYASGFLYSVTVVPLIVLLMARHLDLDRWLDRVILAGAVLLLLVNNADQVLTFRAALAALH